MPKDPEILLGGLYGVAMLVIGIVLVMKMLQWFVMGEIKKARLTTDEKQAPATKEDIQKILDILAENGIGSSQKKKLY